MNIPNNAKSALLSASMLGSKIWALTWNLDLTLADKYRRFSNELGFVTNSQPRSDPREIAGRSLLKRGEASVDEIMAATFGEWPLKGLDIASENSHRVKLENFFLMDINNTFSQRQILGISAPSAERIYLNKFATVFFPRLYGESGTHSFLGHESTHTLQALHSYQANKMFGNETAAIIKGDSNRLESGEIAEKLFARHTDPDQAEEINKAPHLQYLRDGQEIQARLTQVLAQGYQYWKTMPRTREELTAAMIDVGVKAPDDIVQALDQSPTIAETRKTFSSDASKWLAQSIDVNQSLKTLTPEGKTEFWNDTLPKLYADLIEMQGDGPGRARFGLGQNPWPERRRQAGIPVRETEASVAAPQESSRPFFAGSYGFDEPQKPAPKREIDTKLQKPALQ
ncbi:MAG: hypothetical protein JWO78_794 [Micavibrio sp.]|nr:hypothetical protein [Micavibrio sp.]